MGLHSPRKVGHQGSRYSIQKRERLAFGEGDDEQNAGPCLTLVLNELE